MPVDKPVSVIAAIGPLNSKNEANAHSHDGMDVNTEDIQIDFSSKVTTVLNERICLKNYISEVGCTLEWIVHDSRTSY